MHFPTQLANSFSRRGLTPVGVDEWVVTVLAQSCLVRQYNDTIRLRIRIRVPSCGPKCRFLMFRPM